MFNTTIVLVLYGFLSTQTFADYEIKDSMKSRPGIYQEVDLKVELDHLTDRQILLVKELISASEVMDDLFWKQSFGEDKETFLSKIKDEKVRKFAEINYGPWDRLNGDKAFLKGFEDKPLGAQFYPEDMTKEEFEASNLKDKNGLYSVVRRNAEGKLITIAYNKYFADELSSAAGMLMVASLFADNNELAKYLEARAIALIRNEYQESDMLWMDMKSNEIEVVIGPIETYEDALYGYRAGFESYVLLKDLAWSERLNKLTQYLPELQKGLPVPESYKQETPGRDSDLNAYDVLYYAGHSNAGSKTIAINLPNDEEVQLKKGTRRLQLKNAMKAKFDYILLPIADALIAPEQRENITFNAFFANTMFHEVAHGLGIKNTINGKGTVREALKEHASALEEGKADVLGLYMVTELLKKGVLTEGTLKDYYVTFMTSIFRSVRFGASSAHGRANMIRFNYFLKQQAFSKNANGQYQVDMEKMQLAVKGLSKDILVLQGDGNYEGVSKLVKEMGSIGVELQKDLDLLSRKNIPVDIVFNQGVDVLGI